MSTLTAWRTDRGTIAPSERDDGMSGRRTCGLQNGRVIRPVIDTPRIRLVPMTTQHLPYLVDLDSDAEVLRHILGRARTEAEVYAFWGPICADTRADTVGLGWWVGFTRATDDFLGWWDLTPDAGPASPPARAEAGWRLARRHWRQGYATEAATALFEHGFTAIGLRTIWAETMFVNHASRAVMARLGMRHVRTDHRVWDDPLPGAELGEVVYEISDVDWVNRIGKRGMTGRRHIQPISPG